MADKPNTTGRYGDLPPPYTPVATPSYQPPTLVVDANSYVFHKGARFNEFAKPVIPPPPPGCRPNQYQQMQIEKGQFNVVVTDRQEPRPQNKYGTF